MCQLQQGPRSKQQPLMNLNNFPKLNNNPQQTSMSFDKKEQDKESPSISFSNLQSEIKQVPDISITLQLYADLINKLKSTNDQMNSIYDAVFQHIMSLNKIS